MLSLGSPGHTASCILLCPFSCLLQFKFRSFIMIKLDRPGAAVPTAARPDTSRTPVGGGWQQAVRGRARQLERVVRAHGRPRGDHKAARGSETREERAGYAPPPMRKDRPIRSPSQTRSATRPSDPRWAAGPAMTSGCGHRTWSRGSLTRPQAGHTPGRGTIASVLSIGP